MNANFGSLVTSAVGGFFWTNWQYAELDDPVNVGTVVDELAEPVVVVVAAVLDDFPPHPAPTSKLAVIIPTKPTRRITGG